MPLPPLMLETISLDPEAEAPLYGQLYEAIREGVLDGRLKPGTRLPSTRALGRQLSVSRNTVVAAFEQLIAEGYVTARVGDGTRIADIAPDTLLALDAPTMPREALEPSPRRTLSARGEALADCVRPVPPATGSAFVVGLPAVDLFPFNVWGRLVGRYARRMPSASLGYRELPGLPALREAIAAYLGAARNVICDAAQVFVTAGAQAALDLAARITIDPGDPVWIEEPGYLGARGALLGAGGDLIPVRVDAEGMDVETATDEVRAGMRAPRLIYVTPSHQFPLGVTMSLNRRLKLLETAARLDAWILEDDFDSEYRYAGRPVASLQGLDRHDRVLYAGTFSKTMLPSLRVGFLVVPADIAPKLESAIRNTGHSPTLAVQAALADFLGDGHFAAHVRRMRTIYAGRQAKLVEHGRERLSSFLEIASSESGMHLHTPVRAPLGDVEIAEAAAERGVAVTAASRYYLTQRARPALMLGYAGVPEREIPRAVDRLARAIGTRLGER